MNEKRHILVVHGVQIRSNNDLDYDKLIKKLVFKNSSTVIDFDASMLMYEDTNDNATGVFKFISGILGSNVVVKFLSGLFVDVFGDIFIALKGGSTADKIKANLKIRILEIHAAGQPLYLMAHSLGSIYAMEVVNELIEQGMFDNMNDKTSWPIQALITTGSPLGLDIVHSENVAKLDSGKYRFPWLNFWDKNDPIVSGSLLADDDEISHVRDTFGTIKDKGWMLKDYEVNSGGNWVSSHIGYWECDKIGVHLVTLLTAPLK